MKTLIRLLIIALAIVPVASISIAAQAPLAHAESPG
jgi:hypothetical protein